MHNIGRYRYQNPNATWSRLPTISVAPYNLAACNCVQATLLEVSRRRAIAMFGGSIASFVNMSRSSNSSNLENNMPRSSKVSDAMVTVTPPVVQKVLRRRMSPRGIEAMDTLNSLNAAARQLEFTSNQWLDSSVKSLARLRVLIVLLAGEGQPVAHQEIINALQVKRATVSGLMAALERDGLVKSVGDTEDRRRQLAELTEKGASQAVQAIDKNHERLLKVIKDFSKEELSLLRSLLDRLRDA